MTTITFYDGPRLQPHHRLDDHTFYRLLWMQVPRDGYESLYSSLEWTMREWQKARRPYYSLYPCMIDMLGSLDLSKVPTSMVRAPLPALLIRLPKTNEITFEVGGQHSSVESILVGATEWNKMPFITVAIFSGQYRQVGDLEQAVFMLRHWQVANNLPVEECLNTLDIMPKRDFYDEMPQSIIHTCMKIVCGVCLMANDEDFVFPDVLSRDGEAYAETADFKYVERAHRRGKIGWTVGRDIEQIPHFRRPHFAIRWMRIDGIDDLQPRIRPIKGSLVKRSKLIEVPSGYLDKAVIGA